MRHILRRSISIGIVLPAIFALSFVGGTVAEAGPLDARLNGDYSVTMTRNCNNGLTIASRGTATYDGNGGGSFVGQALAEPFGNQSSLTCSLTYIVNADGSFTQVLDCTLNFTAGPLAGNTATLNGFTINGQISSGRKILLLSKTTLEAETQTFTAGPLSGQSNTRVCNGSGLATKSAEERESDEER
jgi:hypothetical protein